MEASSSSQQLPPPNESRPQAGPLPRKRGEIGFRESLDAAQEEGNGSPGTGAALPERHPADRPPDNADSTQPRPPSPTPSAARSDVSSMRKPPNHACWPTWLRAFDKKRYWGITLVTLIRLPLQILILAGTVVAWVFITKQIAKESKGDMASFGSSASIFIHVTFAITVLAQLIFLERGVFFLRAQRYAYLHPGMSRTRNGPASAHAIAFAPWNRPGLPTYAATLAQSGLGTGDVEDNAIAIPPPPAYGNTRGSRLLLQGFMRNSLRTAARSSRTSDALSLAELGERNQTREGLEAPPRDRPVSYRSTDSQWEERCDAERALRLAETLERLENSNSSSTQR